LRAFIFAESGGTGFYDDGRLLIRFENYTFINRAGLSKDLVNSVSNSEEYYRYDVNGQWIPIHDTPDMRYDALKWAIGLDEEAAYESVSMGFSQIMGHNYKELGYSSAKEMFEEFSRGYSAQLDGFTTFLVNYRNGVILKALQEDNYIAAIEAYNGDKNYSGSLEKFEKAAGIR